MSASSNHVVLSGPIVDAIIDESTKGLANAKGNCSLTSHLLLLFDTAIFLQEVSWHR